MGRRLVIIGFLVCFGLAVYAFATRDNKPLSQNLSKAAKDPRVLLEDFIAYKYEGDKLKASLTARLGHFYEPNVVELDGEIRGERLTDKGDIESVNAESATGYFKAASLTKLIDQGRDLDRAELSGFVEVGVKDHLLTTDYAEYLNSDKLVRSQRPVRVEGPGRVFMGDEGFTYSLVTEILEMQGQVKGDLRVEER